MIPKVIDDHPMRRMSECRFIFGNCGRSFLSPAVYKSASAKIIAISWSVFQSLRHFRSASTEVFHMHLITSLVHCYMCCILSGVTPQSSQRLVVAFLSLCSIFKVGRVLIMNFVTKCSMWTVVVSRALLNNVWSISSHSDV